MNAAFTPLPALGAFSSTLSLPPNASSGSPTSTQVSGLFEAAFATSLGAAQCRDGGFGQALAAADALHRGSEPEPMRPQERLQRADSSQERPQNSERPTERPQGANPAPKRPEPRSTEGKGRTAAADRGPEAADRGDAATARAAEEPGSKTESAGETPASTPRESAGSVDALAEQTAAVAGEASDPSRAFDALRLNTQAVAGKTTPGDEGGLATLPEQALAQDVTMANAVGEAAALAPDGSEAQIAQAIDAAQQASQATAREALQASGEDAARDKAALAAALSAAAQDGDASPAGAAYAPGAGEGLGAAAAMAPALPAPGAGSAATPTVTQASVRTPIDQPGFAPAFGTRMAVLVRDGVDVARVHLHPAEMGPVAVQVKRDGTQVRVDLMAEMAATRAALEQALPALASALREAGFTLHGGGVFQGGSSHQGASDFFAQTGSGQQPARDSGAAGTGHSAAGGSPGDAERSSAARVIQRAGLVDVFA